MTILEYLEARTGETDTVMLNTYVADADSLILEYCGLNTVPLQLEGMRRELALRAFNRAGLEGISRYGEGAVTLNLRDLTYSDRDRLDRFAEVQIGEREDVAP